MIIRYSRMRCERSLAAVILLQRRAMIHLSACNDYASRVALHYREIRYLENMIPLLFVTRM